MRMLTITTSDARRTSASRWPLHSLGLDRAATARILEDHGLPTPRRADCGWTPRPRDEPDPAIIRSLLLGPLEDRLRTLCAELGLRGQTQRVVALATDVARQCLRWPVEPGTRLTSVDGRSRAIVVGVKPSGFLEGYQITEARRRELRGERFARARLGLDEHLVWTVDPMATSPGISQLRLSDWRIDDK